MVGTDADTEAIGSSSASALRDDVNQETKLPGDFINMWIGATNVLARKIRDPKGIEQLPTATEYAEKKKADYPFEADELTEILSHRKAAAAMKKLDKLAIAFNKRVVGKSQIDVMGAWGELRRICYDANILIRGQRKTEADPLISTWNAEPSIL
ncbi:MAG: hypothetical protein RIQ56_954 [Candidatus Parcubacteria bacterium]